VKIFNYFCGGGYTIGQTQASHIGAHVPQHDCQIRLEEGAVFQSTLVVVVVVIREEIGGSHAVPCDGITF